MLSEKETSRYSRHLLLPEIGIIGQEKLKKSRVLVIGAGGLGCPVLMYLTSAGVGKIGIVDFDVVDETNLQRQLLYNTNDIGRYKSEIAKQKLSVQNPHVEIKSIQNKLTVQNAIDLFSRYDIIVDGTDNFSTRYMVNDACALLEKPLVSGSIFKFEGQISVFNFKNKDGKLGPTYRCLFPSPPLPETSPSCSEIGVLSILPGIVGTLMTNEVIKIITNLGEILSGKILIIDALTLNFRIVEIERNVQELKSAPQNIEEFKNNDYDSFCGTKAAAVFKFNEISAEELLGLISKEENIQILDVRELNELPEFSGFNSLRIPLSEIETKMDKIAHDKKIIVICQSGTRSKKVIQLLSEKFNFRNLYTLTGGITELVK